MKKKKSILQLIYTTIKSDIIHSSFQTIGLNVSKVVAFYHEVLETQCMFDQIRPAHADVHIEH